MQVVLHLGVHATDSDKLLKTLLRNADDFRSEGVAIPGPGKYRKLMSEMLNALNGAPPAPDARDVLIDTILDEDPQNVDRLILCHEHLFSVPKIAFKGGVMYRKAEERLTTLAQVFAEDELEIFLAIRNPATLLPAIYENTPHDSFGAFLDGFDPLSLRWTDFATRLVNTLPGHHITLWCDEDSPLIWGELVRELAGVDYSRKIIGAFSRLAEIMSKEGMKRFRGYLAEHPDMTEIQKRRVMVAFLDKYALEDEIEKELDLPGWTEDYVDALTDQYEEDLFDLARMPGVTLIAP